MLAERAQEAVHTLHASFSHEAHEQIVIESELKAFIDAADFLISAPPPETRFLRDVVPSLHHPTVMRRQNPIPGDDVLLIDEHAMAVDRIDFGMLGQVSGDKIESAGSEKIVAVEISHNLARCMLESADNRIRLPLIGRRF